MKVEAFFDKKTYTLTYITYDESTKDTVIIDPVWDYDQDAGKTSLDSLNSHVDFIRSNDLNLLYVIESHAHADHLSSSQKIKEIFPNVKIAIGENVVKV